VGSRKGAAVLKAKATKFAESVRPLLEQDDLAGLSAHATARELNRRGVPTPRGGAWTANSVLKLKARLPNRGPAEHPSEGPPLWGDGQITPEIRDEKGQFDEVVDVGRSLSKDRKRQAEHESKPGHGDRGDRKR
jgi:hypothetical protein